jgi:hypothetical protein
MNRNTVHVQLYSSKVILADSLILKSSLPKTGKSAGQTLLGHIVELWIPALD